MAVLILKKGKFKNFVKLNDIVIVFFTALQKEHYSFAAQYEENRNGKFLFVWVALLKL
jgi:hypothetical protein